MSKPSGPALGIDLGTTFSVVAQINSAGLPITIPNSEGQPITPSVVLFDGAEIVVGSVAREALAADPEHVVQLVKRRMGSDWSFEYGEVTYRAEHISSLILRKLVRDAGALVGSVNEAVITVPAYFNDAMCHSTREAGRLADIDVLGLLSEPLAAAMAFAFDKRPGHALGVVVDLGGGTLDITVVEFAAERLRVLAKGGDAYLGGANFDKALFDWFVEQFARQTGFDLNDMSVSVEDLVQISQDWLGRANRAKHDLSLREHTAVALGAMGSKVRLEITRDTFVDLTRVLLDEVAEKIVEVLDESGAGRHDVDVVLAVGGSTRIPAIRRQISDLLGREPEPSVRPDEVVALGASVFAAQRQLERGQRISLDEDTQRYLESVSVADVCGHSIGVAVRNPGRVEGSGSGVTVVLPRNSPLSTPMRHTFYTVHPDETRIVVPLVEGEDGAYAVRIGSVVVEGLPPGRPPHQPVLVTMTYDRDGILEVSALDVNSKRVATTRIDRRSALDPALSYAAAAALREANVV